VMSSNDFIHWAVAFQSVFDLCLSGG
jgi:hypothetical protein